MAKFIPVGRAALVCGTMLSVALSVPAWAGESGVSGANDPQADQAVSDATVAQADQAGKETAGKGQSELAEIVVTAQRRSENLQRVPISVAVVSGAELAASGATNLQQISTLFTGTNVRNASGATGFYIHGVGTSATAVENPVAVYVDDIYYPSQRAVDLSFLDVAQIAVLRGPQGTLFGRNATGGVVQITTREPSDHFELDARTSIDNYATSRTGVWVGGPLGDSVRASLMGSYATQGNGWGYDSVGGYDTFKLDHQYAFRGHLLADLGSNVKIKLSADYQNKAGNTGQNEVPYPGTYIEFDPDRVGDSNVYDSRSNAPSYQTLKDGGASAAIDVDLGFATLSSITAHREGTAGFAFDADRSPTDAFFIDGVEKYNSTSQEIHLASPEGDHRFTWLIGGFYFRFRDALEPISPQFSGPMAPNPTSLARLDTHSDQLATSYAGFGQGTFEFLPGAKLTLGTRYTTEKRTLVGSQDTTLVNGTFTRDARVVNDSIDANNWSYRAALSYDFTPRVMGYVSFDRGFKSGGFNLNDITNPPYQPEKLDSYQVGLRTELFDRRLRFNVDAFYYDYTNLQVVRYQVTSYISNAATARMYGLDVDAQAYFTDDLNATLGLSLLNSKFTNYPNATGSIPATTPGGANTLIVVDASGNRVPYAQPISLNLSLNYTHHASFGDLLFSVTNAYNGKYYHEPDNRLSQDPYDLMGLSATWTSKDKRYSAKLWTTNLFNEHVATQGASQAFGYLMNYTEPPRLFGLTLEMKLGN